MTSNELGTHTVPPSPQVMGVTLSAETVIAMHDASCPNCQREFYAFTDGEYCPECWKAWGKADGSFEVRSKDMAAILHRQLRRPRLKPVFQPPVQGEDANG